MKHSAFNFPRYSFSSQSCSAHCISTRIWSISSGSLRRSRRISFRGIVSSWYRKKTAFLSEPGNTASERLTTKPTALIKVPASFLICSASVSATPNRCNSAACATRTRCVSAVMWQGSLRIPWGFLHRAQQKPCTSNREQPHSMHRTMSLRISMPTGLRGTVSKRSFVRDRSNFQLKLFSFPKQGSLLACRIGQRSCWRMRDPIQPMRIRRCE